MWQFWCGVDRCRRVWPSSSYWPAPNSRQDAFRINSAVNLYVRSIRMKTIDHFICTRSTLRQNKDLNVRRSPFEKEWHYGTTRGENLFGFALFLLCFLPSETEMRVAHPEVLHVNMTMWDVLGQKGVHHILHRFACLVFAQRIGIDRVTIRSRIPTICCFGKQNTVCTTFWE